jgi:hypothetical protein
MLRDRHFGHCRELAGFSQPAHLRWGGSCLGFSRSPTDGILGALSVFGTPTGAADAVDKILTGGLRINNYYLVVSGGDPLGSHITPRTILQWSQLD